MIAIVATRPEHLQALAAHQQRCFPGVDPADWIREEHFASHLRTERLGEFTIGEDKHRSESLAIVQVLILYHLVTAKAAVAVGGDEASSRVDQGSRGASSAQTADDHDPDAVPATPETSGAAS